MSSKATVMTADQGSRVHDSAMALYQENEYWKKEMEVTSVEDWSVEELTKWIRLSSKRPKSAMKPHELVDNYNKYADLIEKLLQVIEQQDIAGSLLVAGGKSYLNDKAYSLLNKSERARLHQAVALVFAAVHEAQELQGSVPYWDRMWRSSAIGNTVCEEYGATDQGAKLRIALEPHPLGDIHYTQLCHLEAANDVVEADMYVDKSLGDSCRSKFKVVSVSPRNDPLVVWSNLIYVRSNIHVESGKSQQAESSVLSGAQKRLQRRRKRHPQDHNLQWELIASVDFSQHGSALPGHWHLNRTSVGELVPHLSLVCEDNSNQREVWHGCEDCCPLWWQFIPTGMEYKGKPRRFCAMTNLK